MSEESNSAAQRVRAALQRASNRIKELEARHREPIAIIGMACRFPGGADPDQFWGTLVAGEDRVREVPDSRLIGEWPDGVPRWAGLLDEVDRFDPAFFGMSPREALSVDPQQRLLLEVAWEAFEGSGLVPATLQSSKTGVFVGLCSTDYERRAQGRPTAERNAYDTTGNMLSTATGRISYTFGLRGPALSLDTACSSSLVAVHVACQSLRSRESDLALAGGVNLILSEETSHALYFIQALSPDGRCKTFDASASGFVRGEGCGLVVLKRLSDAERDGDVILGLIRGSAVNQDGRSTGLTAPNVLAQEALLKDALLNAGIEPEQVGYIECHGTGTSLGDPIEIEALKAVFGSAREQGDQLWLGAAKTNIGHLEGAAGVAGLIKILLALRERRIPPNLHLRRLNPRIKLTGTPLTPVAETVDWRPSAGRRIAGVSSFGISGTNAHVIVEQAPVAERASSDTGAAPAVPLLLSGRDGRVLRGQAARLREFMRAQPEVALVDVGFSLATTRTHFEHRACVLADEHAGLDEFAQLGESAAVSSGAAKPGGRLALLFTGQGAQRPGMGKGLAAAFPVFREAVESISAQFDRWLDRPLVDVMFAEPTSPEAALLNQTSYTQPALFTFEVALYRLLESWGVTAHVLLGHSIGELAAAYVAGVWTVEHAVTLVAARGRLMQALPSGGSMLSVQASEADILPLLAEHTGVEIAGLNGPLSTVVSGDDESVAALERHFVALGRKTRRLSVSHAFHSYRMDPMLADFRRIAESIRYSPPRIAIVSNVSGRLATPTELASSDYWVRHIRQPVRFLDGVQTLERQGIRVCLEVGPHAVLSTMAAACLSEDDETAPALVAASHERRHEADTVVAALGALHCHGLPVDWAAFFAPYQARRVGLPTYAFQRQRYWLDTASPASGVANTVAASELASPVAGGELDATGEQPDRGVELLDELRAMSEPEQARHVLQITLEQLAGVLGHANTNGISPDGDFAGLGLDSLMAVELRKRLTSRTGLKLRATLAYDHPSPRQLSTALCGSLRERLESPQDGCDPTELRLRAALAKLSTEQLREAGLLDSLLVLAEHDAEQSADELEGLSDEALLDAADALLGDD